MSFKDAPWHRRVNTLGDIAESEFLKRHPNAHRLGLNRPPWRVNDMPTEAMKATPDFMLKDRIVEVMGFGRDQLLKLKLFKAEALQAWNEIGPVHLWVWDSHTERCWDAPLGAWLDACWANGTIKKFPDNNREYHELHADHFPEGALC